MRFCEYWTELKRLSFFEIRMVLLFLKKKKLHRQGYWIQNPYNGKRISRDHHTRSKKNYQMMIFLSSQRAKARKFRVQIPNKVYYFILEREIPWDSRHFRATNVYKKATIAHCRKIINIETAVSIAPQRFQRFRLCQKYRPTDSCNMGVSRGPSRIRKSSQKMGWKTPKNYLIFWPFF